MKLKTKNNRLASLAIFRELYNNKKDIYDVISYFLQETILKNGHIEFNAYEITESMNKSYDFIIPEAIVRTALKKLDFITKSNHRYSLNNNHKDTNFIIEKKQEEILENNNHIMQRIFTFIENKRNLQLSNTDKIKITNSFASFLLDENNINSEYSDFISTFIIDNENDLDFMKQLKLIKEGVILYSGIRYSPNIHQLGSWKNKLTIAIETEILFHLAGLNGELQKKLFDDLMIYINEINNKEKLISLVYFNETKEEIKYYFQRAKYLLKNPLKVNPSKTAMKSILDGCSEESDIIEKEIKFFKLLDSYHISEHIIDSELTKDEFKYNIIDKNDIKTLSEKLELSEEDFDKPIVLLNNISRLRAEFNNNHFYNIRYILLSGNSKTLKISNSTEINAGRKVQLATNLGILTNKFWFKLNKGFGTNNYPQTFDVITKAQIILSSHTNQNISDNFSKFQKEVESGKLDEQEIIGRIIKFREDVRRPEDIVKDEILSILDSINHKNIDTYKEEQNYIKLKTLKQKEENNELKINLKKYNDTIKKQENEILKTKKDLLENKNKLKDKLETTKSKVYDKAIKQYTMFKIKTISLLAIYIVIIIGLIYKFSWDTMEPVVYIFGFIFAITAYIYPAISEKEITYKKILENKKNKYVEKQSNFFDFKNEELNSINQEIDDLKIDISNIDISEIIQQNTEKNNVTLR